MKSAIHIQISGSVQGVGFRPYVYTLARDMQLCGYVMNTPQGVSLHLEGEKPVLSLFLERLKKGTPVHSRITGIERSEVKLKGFIDFRIKKSKKKGDKKAFILPDMATCDDCLTEIFDPDNRRYQYPFTNCTHCGPRFSIIESLPYDRGNTAMKIFTMCPECAAEYANPVNRRFHAQPNACPICGPHMELWDNHGKVLATGNESFRIAACSLLEGKIIALKGIGGYQLLCVARNQDAVKTLRRRKNRPDKPFALLYPDFRQVRRDCMVTDIEKEVLFSPEAPIVLLQKKATSGTNLADNIAPENSCLGVMLPYSPLHHLLMKETGLPLVATSGNLSNEPICINEAEALDRLHEIANEFLIHNRPIVRAVDDSVVRVIDGGVQILRSARGYAPHVLLSFRDHPPMIAVGAHLKNTTAIGAGNQVILSQHIGDLETPQAFDTFQNTLTDLQKLYNITPAVIACDLHPGYVSTQYARQMDIPYIPVQHHHAHVMSAVADNDLETPVLGIVWDGTGYGPDGTIWGGEFLDCYKGKYERIAHFRTFPLPGGDSAIKEPRRTAFGMIYELYGKDLYTNLGDHPFLKEISGQEIKIWLRMMENNLNCPYTSSAGRLFDGVASLLGLRHTVSFEGQAAILLEQMTRNYCQESYPLKYTGKSPIIIDWQPMIENILDDIMKQQSNELISTKFHNTLVDIITYVVSKIGRQEVVLSGGCFQNRYLTEITLKRLRKEGYDPYIHRRIPPNDGGIAIGQMIVACNQQNRSMQPKIANNKNHHKI